MPTPNKKRKLPTSSNCSSSKRSYTTTPSPVVMLTTCPSINQADHNEHLPILAFPPLDMTPNEWVYVTPQQPPAIPVGDSPLHGMQLFPQLQIDYSPLNFNLEFQDDVSSENSSSTDEDIDQFYGLSDEEVDDFINMFDSNAAGLNQLGIFASPASNNSFVSHFLNQNPGNGSVVDEGEYDTDREDSPRI